MPIIVVGNKVDVEPVLITKERAESWCLENGIAVRVKPKIYSAIFDVLITYSVINCIYFLLEKSTEYFEVSAKDNRNVSECIHRAVKAALAQRK
jgi:hypothetical protein